MAETVAVAASNSIACANEMSFAVSISPAPLTPTNIAYITQNCHVPSISRHAYCFPPVGSESSPLPSSSPSPASVYSYHDSGGSRRTTAATRMASPMTTPITRSTSPYASTVAFARTNGTNSAAPAENAIVPRPVVNPR